MYTVTAAADVKDTLMEVCSPNITHLYAHGHLVFIFGTKTSVEYSYYLNSRDVSTIFLNGSLFSMNTYNHNEISSGSIIHIFTTKFIDFSHHSPITSNHWHVLPVVNVS